VEAFIDKLRMGIDIPNYPQFRDMNRMFLELLRGYTKDGESYIAHGLSARRGTSIPEVEVIKRNLSGIADGVDLDHVRVKLCITGPYTLSLVFKNRNGSLLEELGEALSIIVKASIFKTRRGETALLAVDEPAFSLIDDPLLDRGSEARERLLKAWERLLWAASARGLETIMHLHNTSDSLYLSVEHLDIIESHVDDPIYRDETAIRTVLKAGKRVKASISRVDFDALIAEGLGLPPNSIEAPYKIGTIWSQVKRGSIRAELFLEDVERMKRRLRGVLSRLGEENVPYAGPECGLRGFPSYKSALESLRRVSEATAS
jgi:5-methyltetrahydropteroyltriglutamate--homocysteine methyltransferase